MRSFKTKHAGSMSLVGMERWLNSDQFKKKESLKRSKIGRFRAFLVITSKSPKNFLHFGLPRRPSQAIGGPKWAHFGPQKFPQLGWN